jgi:hypothetical protein
MENNLTCPKLQAMLSLSFVISCCSYIQTFYVVPGR